MNSKKREKEQKGKEGNEDRKKENGTNNERKLQH